MIRPLPKDLVKDDLFKLDEEVLKDLEYIAKDRDLCVKYGSTNLQHATSLIQPFRVKQVKALCDGDYIVYFTDVNSKPGKLILLSDGRPWIAGIEDRLSTGNVLVRAGVDILAACHTHVSEDVYCHCDGPTTQNYADHKPFTFCLGCNKERR